MSQKDEFSRDNNIHLSTIFTVNVQDIMQIQLSKGDLTCLLVLVVQLKHRYRQAR